MLTSNRDKAVVKGGLGLICAMRRCMQVVILIGQLDIEVQLCEALTAKHIRLAGEYEK